MKSGQFGNLSRERIFEVFLHFFSALMPTIEIYYAMKQNQPD